MIDYHGVHYWKATPYNSFDFEDGTANIELRNRVITRIRATGKARIRNITILLKYVIGTLIGTVLTNIEILAGVI